MNSLTFHVAGVPVAQGSKKAITLKTGRTVLVESSKALPAWRDAIVHTALTARHNTGHQTWTGPVRLAARFAFPHPKHHYGTGRNADLLKQSAPLWHTTKPDCDKLLRALFDSLTTARVWRDDSQCVQFHVEKTYADPDQTPGVTVHIAPLAHTPQPRDVENAAVQGALL